MQATKPTPAAAKPGKAVIVGGGPVGLWTAAQLLKREPGLDVRVLERHESYARSHVLRLDHWSMLLYGRAALDARERAFCEEVSGRSFAGILASPAKSLHIRTNDLEAALRGYAVDLGARVERVHVESPAHARELHPDAKLFVAADGAKSRMREALMPGRTPTEDLQRVVEAKYMASGPGETMPVTGDHYRTVKLMRSMAFEYVGRPRDGRYPATVRLFVDEEQYLGLPEASFKAPLSLASPGVPESIRADLALYLAARSRSCSESAEMGSVKLSKLRLACYACESFAVQDGSATWFLAGDAALGVPYFRALNSGMILSSRLAQILESCARRGVWDDPLSLARAAKKYESHRPAHVAAEFGIAKAKNATLQGYDAWRRASAAKPWQTISWKGSELRALESAREAAAEFCPSPEEPLPPSEPAPGAARAPRA